MVNWLSHVCSSGIILLITLLASIPCAFAEESGNEPEPKKVWQYPWIYVHGGGGIGLSRHDKSAILNSIGEDFEMATGNGVWSYSLNAGFSNIVQYEYRKNNSDHNISTTDVDFSGGWTNPVFNRTKVEMKHESWDTVYKINPSFWTWTRPIHPNKPTMNFFITFGEGRGEYFDDAGDGYEGDSKIMGIEVIHLTKYGQFGYYLRRNRYEYTDNYLGTDGIDYVSSGNTYNANDWHLKFWISVGFGIGGKKDFR